jgi:GT2 family glycosyltransferase
MAVAGELKPAISIIVPCLNHAAELDLCLEGLGAQTGQIPFEVAVVDSASDPEVLAVVGRHPGVRLLRADRRLSAGAARNLGSRETKGELLGFLDADCIPQSGWVQAAVAALQGDAVLASGAVADALPWHFISASDNRLQFADFPPGRPAGPHPYFPAACLAVKRAVFEELGPFDEESAVAQDVLFTREVARRYPDGALFQPEMLVLHIGRARWKQFLAHQFEFGFSRAEYQLRMDRSYAWLGRHPGMGWLVILRRLTYIGIRVAQWNALDLPRFVLQLPILIIGLAAWTRGFYSGIHAHTAPQA